jgi:hypothetical protein
MHILKEKKLFIYFLNKKIIHAQLQRLISRDNWIHLRGWSLLTNVTEENWNPNWMPKRFKYVSLVAHIGEVDISNFVTGK